MSTQTSQAVRGRDVQRPGGLRLWEATIKHWSTTQSTVTLSSAKAELCGIGKGASQAIGLQSLLRDLGWCVNLEIFSDSTAAIGICKRRGLGKVRHLAVSDMWIQDRLASGGFQISKVLGADNPADILTKAVDRACLEKHLSRLQLRCEEGRAESAARIDQAVACLLHSGAQQLRHCTPRRSVEETSILAPVLVSFSHRETCSTLRAIRSLCWPPSTRRRRINSTAQGPLQSTSDKSTLRWSPRAPVHAGQERSSLGTTTDSHC